jgi:hypothetical protein
MAVRGGTAWYRMRSGEEEEEEVGVLAVWYGVANDAYDITYQGCTNIGCREVG